MSLACCHTGSGPSSIAAIFTHRIRARTRTFSGVSAQVQEDEAVPLLIDVVPISCIYVCHDVRQHNACRALSIYKQVDGARGSFPHSSCDQGDDAGMREIFATCPQAPWGLLSLLSFRPLQSVPVCSPFVQAGLEQRR